MAEVTLEGVMDTLGSLSTELQAIKSDYADMKTAAKQAAEDGDKEKEREARKAKRAAEEEEKERKAARKAAIAAVIRAAGEDDDEKKEAALEAAMKKAVDVFYHPKSGSSDEDEKEGAYHNVGKKGRKASDDEDDNGHKAARDYTAALDMTLAREKAAVDNAILLTASRHNPDAVPALRKELAAMSFSQAQAMLDSISRVTGYSPAAMAAPAPGPAPAPMPAFMANASFGGWEEDDVRTGAAPIEAYAKYSTEQLLKGDI